MQMQIFQCGLGEQLVFEDGTVLEILEIHEGWILVGISGEDYREERLYVNSGADMDSGFLGFDF